MSIDLAYKPPNGLGFNYKWQVASPTPAGNRIAATVSAVVHPSSEDVSIAELKETFRLNRLRREYGDFFRERNGRKFLNDRFWAAWLCGILRVFFDERIGAFRYAYMSESTWNRLLSEALIESVGVALLQAAEVSTRGFPLHEICPERIKQLIEGMKAVPKEESVSKGPPSMD